MKRRTNVERRRSVFIRPSYPSEVLKGGAQGVPFVPQEAADGCNPSKMHTENQSRPGRTWLHEGSRGGRPVSQGGGLSKDAESNEPVLFPAKTKKRVL